MSNNNALVSIVLPSYNRQDKIVEAINSCLTQSFKDFELIIIDDCSSDNSREVIKNHAKLDERIKFIFNDKNMRLPATLNIAFNSAIGKYFTWISDDNLFTRDAIEKMVNVLENNAEISLVYADYTTINNEGTKLARIYQEPPEFLPIRDCVGAAFLYRADIAKLVGGYNEDMFLTEDYEYWLRFGLVAKFMHIPESLFLYRVHAQSLTTLKKEEIRKGKKLLKDLFADKYVIPKKLKPIDDLYRWFIGDRTLLSYLKLMRIILLNPVTTVTYILKNLVRFKN